MYISVYGYAIAPDYWATTLCDYENATSCIGCI